jgi:hypothetical protein
MPKDKWMESVKQRTGHYPTAKEWSKYMDKHPDEFPENRIREAHTYINKIKGVKIASRFDTEQIKAEPNLPETEATEQIVEKKETVISASDPNYRFKQLLKNESKKDTS